MENRKIKADELRKMLPNRQIVGYFPKNYTVLDIETTGLDPYSSEITEIAAIRVRNGKTSGIFHTLVHPANGIPPEITELTKIDEKMTEHAPGIRECLPAFREFIGEDILVGYSVGFDISFLSLAGLQMGKDILSNDYLDIHNPAKIILMGKLEHYTQAAVADALGIKVETYHRALADCETCRKIYEKLAG